MVSGHFGSIFSADIHVGHFPTYTTYSWLRHMLQKEKCMLIGLTITDGLIITEGNDDGEYGIHTTRGATLSDLSCAISRRVIDSHARILLTSSDLYHSTWTAQLQYELAIGQYDGLTAHFTAWPCMSWLDTFTSSPIHSGVPPPGYALIHKRPAVLVIHYCAQMASGFFEAHWTLNCPSALPSILLDVSVHRRGILDSLL